MGPRGSLFGEPDPPTWYKNSAECPTVYRSDVSEWIGGVATGRMGYFEATAARSLSIPSS